MNNDDPEPLSADDIVSFEDWRADLTYREVHLLIEGLFDGFRQIKPRFNERVQGTVVGDSWYYKFGFIAGYLLKAGLVAAGLAVSSGMQ